MSGTTSRQKILSYMKRNRTVSARQVAGALRMTPANARHHLRILAADGRVDIAHQRKAGKGRPEKIYHLADVLVGDNLANLLTALLNELPPGRRESVLRKIGQEGIKKQTGLLAGQPLMKRLVEMVQRLNAMHYQARWEAGAEGPRVVLGHCPYAAIIERHPELCQMDASLLEGMLGGAARQTAKLESGVGGLPFCVFTVTQAG